MNILRSSVFRSICRVETMILILMLMMPVVIVFMLIGSYSILHFLLPIAAIFTTLRMLMVISLANHLAEASAASPYFYESKNWFLMQCVIEAVALMLNVSMIVLKNTFMRIPHTRYFLMIAGYLVYLVVQQLFTCFAKERLLRGLVFLRRRSHAGKGRSDDISASDDEQHFICGACRLYYPISIAYIDCVWACRRSCFHAADRTVSYYNART